MRAAVRSVEAVARSPVSGIAAHPQPSATRGRFASGDSPPAAAALAAAAKAAVSAPPPPPPVAGMAGGVRVVGAEGLVALVSPEPP